MQQKGFFASLFDISFDSFVTTKIVKVLYLMAMVGSAIYVVFLIAAAFASDSALGAVILVLSPLIFLLFILYSRVLLEFMIVVFRIYENTRPMAQLGAPYWPPPPQPSTGVQPATPGHSLPGAHPPPDTPAGPESP